MRIPYISSAFFIIFSALNLNAESSTAQPQPANSLGKPHTYYASPLENISVVPTKESLACTGVSYVDMERMTRFLLAGNPYNDKSFDKIKTVVMDFGVKDADPQDIAKLPSKPTDPVKGDWYIPLPKRYFVTLKFYDCTVSQIGTPTLQLSSMLPVGHGIGTFEAFKLMLHELFMYHFENPHERNVVLKLG